MWLAQASVHEIGNLHVQKLFFIWSKPSSYRGIVSVLKKKSQADSGRKKSEGRGLIPRIERATEREPEGSSHRSQP